MVRSFESQGRSFAVSGRGLNPVPVNVTVIDGFEDDDFSEYNGLNSGDWAQNTTTVWDGNSAAESSGFDQPYSVPGDGLNAYYAKGDGTFRAYVRSEGGNAEATPWVRFGVLTENNSYAVEVLIGNNDADILVEESGTVSLVTGGSATLSGGVWYEADVVWDDGTLGGSDGDITYTLTDVTNDNQLQSITGNDTTSALQGESGIGMISQGLSTGEVILWDHFHKE